MFGITKDILTTQALTLDDHTHRILYYILGIILKFLVFRVLYDIKVKGLENVPKNNHCLLMPNHLSHLDGFLVLTELIPRPPVHIIADKKLFQNRFFRKLSRRLNIFSVKKGSRQLNVVKYAIHLVESGNGILWFPEGQRHKNPSTNKCNQGKLGSGMIAHAVHVPIVPIFISGTEIAMPVGKPLSWGYGPKSIEITIEYGKPVPIEDLRQLPACPETSRLVVDRIMNHIENLRP